MTTESVHVGVVFFEGIEDLTDCLESVAGQTLVCRLSVRDNGSNPGPVDALLNTKKEIFLLRDGKNCGFAGGANDLIRSSKDPFVLILNPDVKLAPNYVEALVAVMKANPQVGVAGGKLIREEGEIDSAGIFSSRTRRPVNRGEGEADHGQYGAGEVFAITGTAVLLRRTMLEEISFEGDYFDSDFFIYREDSDLCQRARRRGWRVWFTPTAVAVHRRAWRKGGRRFVSRLARFHSFKNRYLELVKNETWGTLLVDLPWIFAFEMAQLVYVLVREPFLLRAYGAALRLLPKMLKKRRVIMGTRAAGPVRAGSLRLS